MQKKLGVTVLSMTALFVIGCGGGGSTKVVTPEFTTPTSTTVSEGAKEVLTVAATDDTAVEFSIVGGADAALFTIDAQTGALSFKTVPDFENPGDADGNNVYQVTVEAIDSDGNKATQTLNIRVTNDATDDGPSFTSVNRTTIQENQQLDFSISADGAVRYFINGGEDAKLFVIDEDTGKLTFFHFRPDYDFPSDANKDNNYEIILNAVDDKNYSSVQNFTITITDDPDDLIPTRIVWKTGQDDGIIEGVAFGHDRDFIVKTHNNERVIVAGSRMWEDSPHSINTFLDFNDAKDYCNDLSYGGYDDWRAPSRHELAEMLNYGKIGESNMYDDIFQYKKGGYFWTSQSKLKSGGGESDKAWCIAFDTGGVFDKDKVKKYNIRCVRGDKIADHNYFTNEGDIIIDKKTGIFWQNKDFSKGRDWEDAKQHCKKLVFAGYDDWRLPNVNELRTIMPYDDNEVLFESFSSLDYDTGHSWAATEANENDAYFNLNDWDDDTRRDSLIVMFGGSHPKTEKQLMMHNRCIRGGHL
jgi:hypothetical protein